MHGPLVWNRPIASGVIPEQKPMAGGLLPILHALQETFGGNDREATGLIAAALNIPRPERHGAVNRTARTQLREANDFGRSFARRPNLTVPDAAPEYLQKFWEPRMQNIICEHLEQGAAGLDPVAAMQSS